MQLHGLHLDNKHHIGHMAIADRADICIDAQADTMAGSRKASKQAFRSL